MNYFLLILSLILIALTRSHSGFLEHLPDMTIPLLILSGILGMRFNALIIILASVFVDNYAILYQGVSAHCITPAYSVLLVSYYLTFYFAQFLSKSLSLNILKLILIVYGQWFLATMSYYLFITKPWSEFLEYALTWIWTETYPTIIITLVMLLTTSIFTRFNTYAR